ncbi:hypothetical protein [Vibrio spartinae]|uniref:Uncharacterized protein n=1 Tax=Vibrio spartinae TaxID=1918945 RepID=A0A1N6M9G0_9VIBR|nr:hypothetical protein [Vibrio spartinae]SIO96092.1 hypothetical protein VSP9026_03852 [Vibrio spartinae]
MNLVKADYRKHRSRILPFILRAQQRNNDQFANQIDSALLECRAFLFLCDGGFYVLQPTIRNGVVWVNIMFAQSLGKCVLSTHMSEIHQLTRQVGGRGIELFTAVDRLSGFLRRQGFSKDSSNDRVQHWIKEL